MSRTDSLQTFTAVVRTRNFTAAANALELPRANVSRRISELESTLNIQLFFRTTRKVSLTQHGEAYSMTPHYLTNAACRILKFRPDH